MKPKHEMLVAATCVLALVITSLVCLVLLVPFPWVAKEARKQLLEVRGRVSLGDSKSKVDELMRSVKEARPNSLLVIHRRVIDKGREELVFHTPADPRASNWILRVGINKGQVDSIRIRALDVLFDDGSAPPAGAPPDKLASES